MSKGHHQLKKIATGIEGFDQLAEGGLPENRAAVISGSPGSGKTIFGMEFLYKGIMEFGDNAVFMTFEERPEDLKNEMVGFGWDIEKLEKEKKFVFVDASSVAEHQVEVGEYDFGALVTRLKYAIQTVGAKRVVIDGIASLFTRYRNEGLLRTELLKIIDNLRRLDVTTLITTERSQDGGSASYFGVEDFVADSVVVFYNSMVGRERERQIEIVKLRGASHQTGRRPFLIGDEGITVFPGRRGEFAEENPTDRVSIGVPGIDDMTDGGIFRGSSTLLLGPSGTGRTVLGLQFLNEGIHNEKKGVLFSFEEGKAQLYTDAKAFGWDFKSAEKKGLLRIIPFQPEGMPLESYLKKMRKTIEEFDPDRVVIDSVTPLAHAFNERRFRHFVVALNSYLKGHLVTSLMNYTVGKANEGIAAESDMAVIADNIIRMDFMREGQQMNRTITIEKSRSSAHDKNVKKYDITASGMCILGDDGESCAIPQDKGGASSKRRK